tara:strand:+ start:69 stop:413 length:345 start_codon:yes stop_codon:yes gene_type:complete
MPKTDFIDDVYAKATRPNPPPKKWRVNPSNAQEKKKLVDYCTDLEDAIVGQQDALTRVWTLLSELKDAHPNLKSRLSAFMISMPRTRYRKDRSATLGDDARVYDEQLDGEQQVG